jgi:gas vesicle protein
LVNKSNIQSKTLSIVTQTCYNWYQKWSDQKLHWILIVVPLYYKNGANDQTTELMKVMQEMLQEMKDGIRTNQEKMDANQTKIGAEIKTIQEEMKAQVGSLTSRIDANQEEMKEEIKSRQAVMKATVSAILTKDEVLARRDEGLSGEAEATSEEM